MIHSFIYEKKIPYSIHPNQISEQPPARETNQRKIMLASLSDNNNEELDLV